MVVVAGKRLSFYTSQGEGIVFRFCSLVGVVSAKGAPISMFTRNIQAKCKAYIGKQG